MVVKKDGSISILGSKHDSSTINLINKVKVRDNVIGYKILYNVISMS